MVLEKNDHYTSNQEIWISLQKIEKYIFSQDLIIKFCMNYPELLAQETLKTAFKTSVEKIGYLVYTHTPFGGDDKKPDVFFNELGDISIVAFTKLHVVVILDVVKEK